MNQYTPRLEPWPAEFAGLLPVSEIFYSLQGEGRFAGQPAVFIRLKFCNLGCIWCDTRFTWDIKQIEPGELLSPYDIARRAAQALPQARLQQEDVHIVITGGEPMLHQDRLPNLIHELASAGFTFYEIETNGAITPAENLCKSISWWNCSPKLSNNGLPRETNSNPDALAAIAATGRADFKFVVRDTADIDEVELDYVPLLPRNHIYLMPEGVTRERQLSLTPFLMKECMNRGFRFSPRLHILAWNNERGR